MSYGAVQFYGIDSVVEAYQNKKTPHSRFGAEST